MKLKSKKLAMFSIILTVFIGFGITLFANNSVMNNKFTEIKTDYIETVQVDTISYQDSLKNELILAVDKYISKKSPKANNSISASIVEHGLKNNIDICFIMSQTQLETNFGAVGVGKESSCRSLFGVIKKKYPSYDAAIEDYTRLLKKSYLVKGRDEHFLMKNYITGSGYRYAAAMDYEQKLSKIYKSITKSTEIDELQKLFDSI